MTKNIDGVYMFIDAGYLSKLSEHFGEGQYLKYDIKQLPITLAKTKKLWVKKIFYYTAPPYQSSKPTKEEIKRRKNHDNFVENILRQKCGFIVREGRCQKNDTEDYRQKGVDNLIDIDLMDLCFKNEVKKIIFLACDTDFVPILNKIREDYGIKVVLAYYSDRKRKSKFSMSNHLLTVSDETIFIEKKHFTIFDKKKDH